MNRVKKMALQIVKFLGLIAIFSALLLPFFPEHRYSIITIATILSLIVFNNPWARLTHNFRDLAHIVLLVNKASAEISRLQSESEIYQAINTIFTESPDFDAMILKMSDTKDGFLLAQVSLAPFIMNAINDSFIRFKKTALADYVIPFKTIPILDAIATHRESKFFKRSELLRQAVGEIMANLVQIMGESDNVGLPIIKNDEVIGILVITAPALADEFIPAAHNLADIITRQLESIDAQHKITAMNERLITKNKDLTEAMAVSHQLAIEANKANEAKSTFLANMSHEIRTPLNAITGFIDSVLLDDLSDDHRDQLTLARTSTLHLGYLLNDILDISKIEAHEIVIEQAPFSLHKLSMEIESICNALLNQKKKSIELLFVRNFPENEQIISDQFRVRQILINLLGNAIKFTDAGSVSCTISITGKILILEIADTGIGISDAQKELIFEPFKQADASTTREYGGTGLGLTITSQLIALMGGTLNLDIHPKNGKSTIFTVSLPYGAVATPAIPQATPSKPRVSQGAAILVVDDNNVNRLVAKKILEKLNYTVSLADNGEVAVQMVQENRYNLILMDLQMPILDGFGATEKIREYEQSTGHRTPILAMTANTFTEDRARCEAVGMDGFIGKPIDIDELMRQIASHTTV